MICWHIPSSTLQLYGDCVEICCVTLSGWLWRFINLCGVNTFGNLEKSLSSFNLEDKDQWILDFWMETGFHRQALGAKWHTLTFNGISGRKALSFSKPRSKTVGSRHATSIWGESWYRSWRISGNLTKQTGYPSHQGGFLQQSQIIWRQFPYQAPTWLSLIIPSWWILCYLVYRNQIVL